MRQRMTGVERMTVVGVAPLLLLLQLSGAALALSELDTYPLTPGRGIIMNREFIIQRGLMYGFHRL